MFSKPKPAYTTEDYDAAVLRLERLEKLRDKAMQLQIMHKSSPAGDKYKQLYEGYLSNTRTAQLYLDHLNMKGVNKQ